MADDLIADRMAMLVVDDLETVDVQRQDREGLPLRLPGFQRLLQSTAVEQAGQRIGARLRPQDRFVVLVARDVLQRAGIGAQGALIDPKNLLPTERNQVGFQSRFGDLEIALPIETMLGTVGVAPPAGEVRTSLVPERFGGNMDTPEMKVGTTVYLGVNVEGALFSIGDGHYRQGEGESCGTAVEGAMNSVIMVELLKGNAPLWPRLENDDYWMVVGSSRPMEDAWRIGQVEMVRWILIAHGSHMAPTSIALLIARRCGGRS